MENRKQRTAMNTRISPDDPRLTTYALGEMEAAERAEFETLLQQDASAQATVAEIRATARALGAALEGEPVPAVAPMRIEQRPSESQRAKILRFPQFYFIVSGTAAACFALFFAYWQQTQPAEYEAKQYIALDLAKKEAGSQVARREQAAAAGNMPAAVAMSVPQEADELQEAGALHPVAAAAKSAGASRRFGFAANEGESRTNRFPADKDSNTEAYARQDDNPFLAVAQNPLSTFSVDVDTASYANVRRFLSQGRRPPRDAVRIEELVNYFPYRYAPPVDGRPFAASMEVASAPWAPEHRLVRIGLKGREVSDAARPRANLVFLLDVSGSMDEPNKLPLVKESLRLLTNRLRADDRVAIVVYAGASGLALPPTSAAEKAKILDAIDELKPGGSTNGAAGIQLAYDIAKANFVTGGVNRVILATDGDFNVGTTSEGDLTRLIEEQARSGVFLTVLGFGMGNYKDSTLEKLADKGNGNYAYIDTAAEARKALVEQAGGTLVTIAKDVKLQVEFNPAQVQAYRLIGYENRLLRKEDFNNDKIDAGEIGAGHTVTALYEIVPAGAAMPETGSVDPLKYQKVEAPGGGRPAPDSGELLTLKVRYKEPAGDVSTKLEFPLRDEGRSFEDASADFKFAASVAAFGMILRDSPYKGAATLPDVGRWAQAGLEQDAGGYRAGFLGLLKQAGAIRLN
jgi:Ca-activated chloride channel family protein